MPGRIIGVSRDVGGHVAYRMALQTREQHIRRDKATSNICTAQALLANIAGFYAVYHGPLGLTSIARRVHQHARLLERELGRLGIRQLNDAYFDTLRFEFDEVERLRESALAQHLNFRYRRTAGSTSRLTKRQRSKTSTRSSRALATARGAKGHAVDSSLPELESEFPPDLARTSAFLTHPVFNTHHSETEMMRYLRRLERKDIGLDTSMIPLGSCTMKLNAATEMLPLTWPEFSKLHPFAPVEQSHGYQTLFRELEAALCRITGFAAVSLQPNSGAQGEFAGLMVIRAYHRQRGRGKARRRPDPSVGARHQPGQRRHGRDACRCRCERQARQRRPERPEARKPPSTDRLAALMITYPSTHGVFEEQIQEVCAIVHQHGGQVYLDGANMNAQVGLTNPAAMGADVCHLNLHKTFSIPHGGGGPGMGPIGVAAHLAPYLPGPPARRNGRRRAIHAVSAAPGQCEHPADLGRATSSCWDGTD